MLIIEIYTTKFHKLYTIDLMYFFSLVKNIFKNKLKKNKAIEYKLKK